MNSAHSTSKKTRKKSRFSWHKFDLRHPFFIPVSGLVLTFFTCIGLYFTLGGQTVGANDSHIVRLYIDGKTRTIPTRANKVSDLLQELDVTLRTEDIVEPAREAEIDQDGFAINVYFARPVTVVDDGKVYSTLSAQQSSRLVAEELGIKVYPEDAIHESAVLPAENALLGEKLVIDRATPVLVNLYGTIIQTRSHAQTVEELLREKDIAPLDGDTVTPAGSTALTNDLQVHIARFGTQIIVEEVAIESPIESTDDFNLTLGSTRVIDPGIPGKKIVTYEIILTNGIESGRRAIQEVVVSEPTARKVARGRKAPVVAGNKAELMAAAGISADEFHAVDYIISHESGWRVNAMNAGGCAGLGQACPGAKLERACPAWQSDPVCQLQFFSGYARGRYGSWTNAYSSWQVKGWW